MFANIRINLEYSVEVEKLDDASAIGAELLQTFNRDLQYFGQVIKVSNQRMFVGLEERYNNNKLRDLGFQVDEAPEVLANPEE